MYSIDLTSDQSAHIQELIDSFPGDMPNKFHGDTPFVKKYRALPMYLGWTETTGLLSDGRVVRGSSEGDYEGLKPVDDRILFLTSLMEAAKRYPGCDFLIPQRPLGAVDCDACNGMGTIQIPELSKFTCPCGGVGWIDS
ncbi:hypothetical protein [Fuerstiella marisgermanici]|uniref:Uncharacterized protein n=1 Tax=Fuerstiella marisgermanici TaxID=1891926 RepID=A0A1P8WF51_9PLAN|nr:hypothetical protein [Fuerstiella marisgermanici]APZ92681.1 hypothetical protein Fuma_02292 [Fuerstiella marisgermanici]